MDKQELIRDMKQSVKNRGFMSKNQIAGYLGKDPQTVNALVKGLEYYPSGRAHLYFIRDVAERILEKVTW